MTTLRDQTAAIQRAVGVPADGVWGPTSARAVARALGLGGFDRAAFLARFVNRNARAIGHADMVAAAARLDVPVGHLQMVRKVESGGVSFDQSGRPIILPEPHIFYRQTRGAHGRTAFSYPSWGERPYPKSYNERWDMLADMAERDEAAAIESASWGLWQIMGFHWQALGYESAQAFARSMVESEVGHLEALVRFLEVNQLADELRACRAGDPDSCRPFARAYNGPGYEKNKYHVKMAGELAR